MYRHCGEKKQFMHLISHGRQGCLRNKNAASVSIPEKIYPNLLTDSTARDLEVGADLVEFMRLYNASWYRDEGGDAMVDEGTRQRGDASAAPALAPTPTPALARALVQAPVSIPIAAPTAVRPCTPSETQESTRLPRQTIEMECKDSRQRGL
jgi:hypothetical protein